MVELVAREAAIWILWRSDNTSLSYYIAVHVYYVSKVVSITEYNSTNEKSSIFNPHHHPPFTISELAKPVRQKKKTKMYIAQLRLPFPSNKKCKNKKLS